MMYKFADWLTEEDINNIVPFHLVINLLTLNLVYVENNIIRFKNVDKRIINFIEDKFKSTEEIMSKFYNFHAFNFINNIELFKFFVDNYKNSSNHLDYEFKNRFNYELLKNDNDEIVKYVIELLFDKENNKWNVSSEYSYSLNIYYDDECWHVINGNNNDLYVDLLLNNPDEINDGSVYSNNNTRLLEYVLSLKDSEIDWTFLSCNSNNIAVDLLLQNKEKIDWDWANYNENDRIVDLLLENPDKISKRRFLISNKNPKAIKYCKDNIKLFKKGILLRSSLIIERDYSNWNRIGKKLNKIVQEHLWNPELKESKKRILNAILHK